MSQLPTDFSFHSAHHHAVATVALYCYYITNLTQVNSCSNSMINYDVVYLLTTSPDVLIDAEGSYKFETNMEAKQRRIMSVVMGLACLTVIVN